MAQGNQSKSGWRNEFKKINEKPPPTSAPTGEENGDERRKHHRFEVDGASTEVLPKGLLTLVGIGRKNIARAAIDLSQGGARLLLSERLRPGTKTKVRIEIEKYKDAIESLAVVRWCFESGQKPGDFFAGVMFTDLDEAEKKKVALMREWFTSPQFRAIRATRVRQKSGSPETTFPK